MPVEAVGERSDEPGGKRADVTLFRLLCFPH